MNSSHSRRPLVAINIWGASVLHPVRPYIVAWWSAAFPGFGHYLLNMYLRGTLLTLSEVIINSLAHINEAIVYSFCGDFERVKLVLQPKWMLGYIIIYFFTIWDSFRAALFQNAVYNLAQFENERVQTIFLHPFEFQYIEKKNPLTAAFYSCLFPGLGQVYNHQIGLAVWAKLWWWLYLYLSNMHTALFYMMLGDIQTANSLLHPQWLLFMPSIWGGSMYYAYLTALEHNRLFRHEQRQYFAERYRDYALRIFT